MSENKKVLVVGRSDMDLSLNVFKLPEAGEALTDDGGVAYTPGGSGVNAAIAFKRLGLDSVLCTRLGADSYGRLLFELYKSEGIATNYIKADQEFPTGLNVIIKESDGARRSIYYPGANSLLSTENIRDAFSCEPDALYLDFAGGFDTVLSAAKLASARGVPIFLDAAPADKTYSLDVLPEVEIFSPNENETFEYTGKLPQGANTALVAALSLKKLVKCKYLVIKQGERGSFVYDGKHYHMIPAYRIGKPVDPSGAGDAFTAALTAEYLRCGDITASVKYASAAGAVTVMRKGTSISLPTDGEVRAFMEKNTV